MARTSESSSTELKTQVSSQPTLQEDSESDLDSIPLTSISETTKGVQESRTFVQDFRFPDPPEHQEQKPPISELIMARTITTIKGCISCFPLIITFFLLGWQIQYAISIYYKRDGVSKDGVTWRGRLAIQGPIFIVTAVVSAEVIWICDMVAYAVATGETKRILNNWWLKWSTVVFLIGQTALMIMLHFDVFGKHGASTRTIPGYAFPLTVMWGFFYGVERGFEEMTGRKVRGFMLRAALQTLVLIPMLVFYTVFGLEFFFGTSDFGVRVFIRFIVHPILQEITLMPWRLLTLWARDWFSDEEFPNTYFEMMIPQFIFMFSFLGRFLVASSSDFGTSIILAAGLSISDVMIRTSTLHRDRSVLSFFIRLKGGNPNESTILRRDASKLYASWILIDEISEICGIFMAPFLIIAFKFADNASGTRQPWWSLLLVTLISIVMEFGGDTLKILYYASWKPPKWIRPHLIKASKSNQDLSRELSFERVSGYAQLENVSRFRRFFMSLGTYLGTRSARFWNSVEYAVHDAIHRQHPKTFLIFSYYIWCLGVYVVVSLLYDFINFDYNPVTGEYYTYFAAA